jgi:hypothetical protein
LTSEEMAETPTQRAMNRTNSWKPNFERRQSWNKEDQKRALQMTGIDDVKSGSGFSERTS